MLILLFFGIGMYHEKSHWQDMREQLKEQYGKKPCPVLQKHSKELLEVWSKRQSPLDAFQGRNAVGGELDALTWKDLNMDAVFLRVNYTMSDLGCRFLYHTLKHLETREEILQGRESKIAYFQQQEEERLQLQLLFAKLGSNLKGQKVGSSYAPNKNSFLPLGLLFVSGCCLALWPLLGSVALFGTLCFNMVSYLQKKEQQGQKLADVRYTLGLCEVAQKLVRKHILGIAGEQERLQDILTFMKPWRRRACLVTMSGTSSPFSVFWNYICMLTHVDLICLDWMVCRLSVDGENIQQIEVILGELELCVSIGMYRASLSGRYCIPEFVGDCSFVMKNGYSPLLEHPVANSLETSQGILLTGSNASGKSTFLRTCAVNLILSQTLHTALAQQMKFCPGNIYTSMAIRDDLLAGESYYMAEIRAIKRILDAAEGQDMVYCFLDEVLRGTNTVERIAASTELLAGMASSCLQKQDGRILCFAATHDLELTRLLEQCYTNYHFEEEWQGDDICFSYLLREGRATTHNAIRLLAEVGFDEKLVAHAKERASHFMERGSWQ